MRFWSKSQGVDAWWQMRVFAMVGSEIFVGVKQCVSNKERGWQAVSFYGMCLANCADFVRETLCICEFFILTLPFKVTVLTKKRHSRVLLGIHWGFSLTKNVFIGCFLGEVAHLRSAWRRESAVCLIWCRWWQVLQRRCSATHRADASNPRRCRGLTEYVTASAVIRPAWCGVAGVQKKQPPRANRDGCYAVISLLISWQELLQELLQELPERPWGWVSP